MAVQPEHFLHKPFSAEALLHHVVKALPSEPIQLRSTPIPSPAGEVRWADFFVRFLPFLASHESLG